ncbi:hypothetical protein [Myxococcus eversor]|uniref:hypothetical protein n=1 Tax=Myxococcus eversor TaxID=2709661 RepID=UPI0013D60C20|nr:hypothetical protein [Myxococcus eversor]
MKLTTTVLDDLEAKAKAATPGPWVAAIEPQQAPGGDDADLPSFVRSADRKLVRHIRELRESLLALTPGHLHGTEWDGKGVNPIHTVSGPSVPEGVCSVQSPEAKGQNGSDPLEGKPPSYFFGGDAP